MKKAIHFFNRSYQELSAALRLLNQRYRIVRLFRYMKNGLYYGWFEVSGYMKRVKWEL